METLSLILNIVEVVLLAVIVIMRVKDMKEERDRK